LTSKAWIGKAEEGKKTDLQFPRILEPLFEPYRYKVLYGGRGGCKSWGIAIALLLLGRKSKLRILCARELQKSIKDSVHKLLSDRTYDLNLQDFYSIQTATIKGLNGTEFFFEGLRHNASQIKSYEGIDIVWVEEAAAVTKSSWEVLIPTIRKEGSEIWVSYNPELESDDTHQRFAIKPPADSFVRFLNWSENPWFPEVLRKEKDELREKDYDAYLNVWEGRCKVALEGAIYADELREAEATNRITSVPHNPNHLVNTFWDLGYSDCTSIWFIQKVGFQWHVIDFYQMSHKKIAHYAKVLKEKQQYVYGKCYIPHDGRANHLGAERTIEESLKSLGFDVEIAPGPREISLEDGIHAVRTVFSSCWFDHERTGEGIQHLRRYRYKVDIEKDKVDKKPLHDNNCHAADALRTFAVVPYIMTEAYTNPTHEPQKMATEWDPYREVNT